MISGNPDRFGIEAEVSEIVDGWTLGRFRFWLCGRPVGNWDDTADLGGCLRWLEDFATVPRDRHEPTLEDASAETVFRYVYDPVMASDIRATDMGVKDAYSRFHISHLGMSAFETYDVLLIFENDGAERCLWRDARSGAIAECRLSRGEMESVAAEFVRHFKALVAGAGS
jgi:hypothetical protein